MSLIIWSLFERNADTPLPGAMTTLATNFVYAGESITAVGISTFDDQQQQLYYATNVASAFIYGVDVSQKVLLPPVDIGAQTILE